MTDPNEPELVPPDLLKLTRTPEEIGLLLISLNIAVTVADDAEAIVPLETSRLEFAEKAAPGIT
ncbi:hypothetical protein D3C87_2039790 [compost metagenome]